MEQEVEYSATIWLMIEIDMVVFCEIRSLAKYLLNNSQIITSCLAEYPVWYDQ